jgi:putative ABC transport system permease protein
MYIIKNAFRCIGRAKGRNILIGVIVLVIALSSCLGLSIRQAAESAKSETLSSMSVTATISFDRNSAMAEIKDNQDGEDSDSDDSSSEPKEFDRSSFKDMMNNASDLSLEDYQLYATADSVSDFYYSMTSYVNGSDDFEPVSTTEDSDDSDSTETTTDSQQQPSQMGGDQQGGMMGDDKIFGSNSDFSLVGYSSESAMASFVSGTSTVTDGTVFATGSANNECIISDELATYNSLSVGDKIKITNPNNDDETYKLKIVGIYTDSSSNENSFSMFGSTSSDQANQIYVSYETLAQIVDDSKTASSDDDDTAQTAITGTLSPTYVFSDVDSYEKFEDEAKELGLDDSYTISSSDVSNFENSMVPLETLSKMAGYFLIVILLIGAIILVVINIFNVRERKYEIGVLTAMGMKKGKVALQFLTEIFAVTLVAVLIGAGIGAVSSVPVTNALLENQVSSQTSQTQQVEQNFGRGGEGDDSNAPADNGEQKGGAGKFMSNVSDMFGGGENSYVTEVSSAMNLTVLLQMMGICILLTLISGAVSMMFIMRYEPLKILANRD